MREWQSEVRIELVEKSGPHAIVALSRKGRSDGGVTPSQSG